MVDIKKELDSCTGQLLPVNSSVRPLISRRKREMMRLVNVPTYTLGYLAAHRDLHNLDELVRDTGSVDVDAVFYSTLFQAGAHSFQILYDPKYPGVKDDIDQIRSSFIRQRVNLIPDTRSAKIDELFRQQLHPFLPKGYYHDSKVGEKYAPLSRTISFLNALALAASKDLDMVFPYIPVAEEITDLLPDEVLYPVSNVLRSIQQESLTGPLPKLSISRSNYQRFNQLLEADLFGEYAEAHNQLACESRSFPSLLTEISRTGTNLFQRHRSLLFLGRISLTLIPLTTKIVDTAFGKLPGALAEFFGNLLTDKMKTDKRIVVYRCDDLLTSLLLKRLEKLEERKREDMA